MIEDMRNNIAGIDANIDEANTELIAVYKSLEIPEEETNLQRLERLSAMLEDALLTSSLVATHYQSAGEHRKIAEEAITASGVSIETELGEKILGAMIRGAGTMDAIPGYSEELQDHLEDLKYRLIAYSQLDEVKSRAEEKARQGVSMCVLGLKAATDTSKFIKKGLENV